MTRIQDTPPVAPQSPSPDRRDNDNGEALAWVLTTMVESFDSIETVEFLNARRMNSITDNQKIWALREQSIHFESVPPNANRVVIEGVNQRNRAATEEQQAMKGIQQVLQNCTKGVQAEITAVNNQLNQRSSMASACLQGINEWGRLINGMSRG